MFALVEGERVAEGHETKAAPSDRGVDKSSAATNSTASGSALPSDRFDNLPKSRRVGVHRVIGRPHRFWIYFVSALLGFALLTTVGVIVIQVTGADLKSLTESVPKLPKVAPAVAPVLDPEATVVVFNGTPMANFEAVVDGAITKNGWGQILFSSPANSNDVQISAVFYSDPADEAAALALAKELGGVSIFQTSDYDEYGARLIVLLGVDYAGPGSDQLVFDSPEAPAE